MFTEAGGIDNSNTKKISKTIIKLGGRIVWKAHNTVFGSKRSAIKHLYDNLLFTSIRITGSIEKKNKS